MDILILAGGRGTRLGDTGKQIPKALVQVAGKPLIQHVIDTFRPGDENRIWILGGYKIEELYRYFSSTYPYRVNKHGVFENVITGHDFGILDTGYFTETNGRLVMAMNAIKELSDPFCVTYCDSVCSVDPDDVVEALGENLACLTAVRPESRFGNIELDDMDDNKVSKFKEKTQQSELINGGFIVMRHSAIPKVNHPLEVTLTALAEAGQLGCHEHKGFWTCVDAERDIERMERWIKEGRP